MVWTCISLGGVALLQDGENSFSSDPLRDWRLEFYRRYLATGWGFSPRDRQSWAEVDVLYGPLCWTWLPAWIKYVSWTCCSTLFGNNNILLRVISLRLCPRQPQPLLSFILSFSSADTNKHTQRQRLTFSRVRECYIAITSEHRGWGEREKKEGVERDGIKSIRFDGMVM